MKFRFSAIIALATKRQKDLNTVDTIRHPLHSPLQSNEMIEGT